MPGPKALIPSPPPTNGPPLEPPRFTWSLTITASNGTSCAISCRSVRAVTVVPSHATAEDVLALKPDGVFLSNGPGDPEPLRASSRASEKTHRKSARFRHLSWPSDSRPRLRRQDLQAEIRPSWRQPSGAQSRAPARSKSHPKIMASVSTPIPCKIPQLKSPT